MLRFATDAFEQHFVQGEGALVEGVQTAGLAEAGDFHEDGVDVGGDVFVGGDEAEVGVDARGALVVVARTEVGVAFQTAFFAADDECHFGVDFVAEYAVNDVRARVFEALRPVDVVGFVETRHQFDDDGHLFARQRGVHQGFGQLGSRAGAVNRHFDGDDVGIGGGFADEADDGFEGLVGMVQQDVLPRGRIEYRAVFFQRRGHAAGARGEFEVWTADHVGHGHQAHEVDGAFYLIEVGGCEAEMAEQEFAQLRRTGVGHFEAHTDAVFAVVQLALDGGAQVGEVFFVDGEIAVACEAELVAAFHFHAGEKQVDVFVQDGRQKDEALVSAADFGGQFYHARQDARGLDDGHARGAAEGVAAFEFYGEIERFVQRAREGVRGVEADGGKYRPQFAVEIAFNPRALFGRPVAAAIEMDAGLSERGLQFFVEHGVLFGNQAVRFFRGGGHGFGGRQAAVEQAGGVAFVFAPQPGHAYFEKFVEVGRDDAQKPQPLQQRHAHVLRLCQNAAVEGEQAQFAAEKAVGSGHGGLLFVCCRSVRIFRENGGGAPFSEAVSISRAAVFCQREAV
ncbi:hypothetical protein HMPREF9120_01046 [Neisseria sp. oral taxon 020 str. F0370]|nr:hypothetical protein HMPREF9120_01046 [Neisseria sp. oral taxon 020 str. F0370]